MPSFHKLSKLTLGFLISVVVLWSSTYAFELNSGNIVSYCSIWATDCYLGSQWITSIASDTFVWYTNLTTLYLNNNQISSIESGAFDGLTSLTNLYLSNNLISSIESGDFDGLTSLTNLYLNNNLISSIESGDFDGWTSLTTLYLNNNQISSIESGDFDGLTSLTILYLSNNLISSIESGDFDGLSSLTYLDLYWNQISSIESGDFDGLSSLTNLYLNNNLISSIESGDFDGLTSLMNLNLNVNCIDTDNTLVTDYLNTLPWIYYSLQSVCVWVQYSPSMITSWPVTGSLFFTGPASSVSALLLDNPDMILYDHVFTGNWSHLYDYSSMTDNNGFLWSRYMTNNAWLPRPDTILWSVTWIIDTTPPIWTLSYSTTGITNQSVIATLTLNETGSVTNNSGSTTYTFTGNGIFTFAYQDIAGNTGSAIATVNWIDKTAPIITLNGSSIFSGYVGDSYTDAWASWTDAVAGTGTIIGSWTINTALAGTYIITYTITDTAGNTTSATRTVILTAKPITSTPWYAWGGWGGWGSLIKDNCPDGDYTSSYYDGSCGTKPITKTGTIITTGIIAKPINNNTTETPTTEQEKAYEWALSVWITTIDTIQEARLDSRITRAELAKMLSVYMTEVLGKTVVKSDTACSFVDSDQSTKDLLPYITQACQLRIMGLQSDGKTPLTNFNPNSLVTRAEFGTVLSRVLYGDRYNSKDTIQWREWHLQNLQQQDIISVVTPTLQEKRGWIMLMLYRNK